MKHFDILLRKKLTETDLYIQELVLRKDLEGRDRLVLFSQACLALLWKFISPESRLELRCDVLLMLKTAYTSMGDKIVFSSEADVFSTVFARGLTDRMRLSSTDADVLSTVYARAEDLLQLLETIRGMDTVKYISPESEAALVSDMNCALWRITKYASAEAFAYLLTNLAAYSRAYVEARGSIVLFTSLPTSRLVRYRNLGETFPLTLGSMENRTLEDLILEVIE